MTRTEAAELAGQIAKTWRGGPHADVWAEELEELHFGQAQATYHQLRKSEEHGPTIARFLAHYRSLTRDDDELVNCRRCDGAGFVECTDHRRHSRWCRDPEDCACHAVDLCDCAAGRQRDAAFRRVQTSKPTTHTHGDAT